VMRRRRRMMAKITAVVEKLMVGTWRSDTMNPIIMEIMMMMMTKARRGNEEAAAGEEGRAVISK